MLPAAARVTMQLITVKKARKVSTAPNVPPRATNTATRLQSVAPSTKVAAMTSPDAPATVDKTAAMAACRRRVHV